MKNRFAIKLVAAAALAVVTQSTASAEGIRLKAGLAKLSYQNPYGNQIPKYKISGPAMVLGASYVFSDVGIFVDLTHRSLIGNQKWNAAEINNNLIPDQPGKFSDNTITVGKMLGDGLFAYGGYQSQLEQHELSASGFFASKSVTTSGFFLGAGKAYSLGGGWLTPTGALAMMGQKMSTSNNQGGSGSSTNDPGLGYSLGLSYSYPLTEIIDVTAEGKRQQYNPKGSDAPNVVTTYGLNVVGKF